PRDRQIDFHPRLRLACATATRPAPLTVGPIGLLEPGEFGSRSVIDYPPNACLVLFEVVADATLSIVVAGHQLPLFSNTMPNAADSVRQPGSVKDCRPLRIEINR